MLENRQYRQNLLNLVSKRLIIPFAYFHEKPIRKETDGFHGTKKLLM